MKKAAYNIMPGTEEILKTMGEQIKLARLRIDLSTELVAERAGISRSSLWKVESGNPAVAMKITSYYRCRISQRTSYSTHTLREQ